MKLNTLNFKYLYTQLHNIIDLPEIFEQLNFRVSQYNFRNN